MVEIDGANRPWWRAPAVDRVWSAVADRLERAGLVATGTVTVDRLTLAERRGVSELLGREVLRERVRIDLADLDARLRVRAAIDVVAAAEAVLGRPLVDRPALAAARAEHRAAPHLAARAAWDIDPFLPWILVSTWLDGLNRDGVLARDPDPVTLVTDALAVVGDRREHLSPSPNPPSTLARTELAARLLADAHALDDERRLASTVLRLVALLDDTRPGGGHERSDAGPPLTRRQQWERIGVLTDRVSSTCLVAGLPGVGQPGRPVHVTWHDLDNGLGFAANGTVLVCENPRVLEAALEFGITDIGVVCTSGRPALVVIEVLHRLRAAGARLLYHGDFDWPGISMANDLVTRLGVEPWRMSAADYLSISGRLPLAGSRVDALWDPELAPAMTHRDLAVHEEAALPQLLFDLRAQAAL